ncbi:hypothetical protein G7046_g409 [Stylonectria norvegica]|nr:hypothetical protein G7046_g409 [Stylonectria norvegica]
MSSNNVDEDRDQTQTPDSERFSHSPWSVLSDLGTHPQTGNIPLEPIAIIGMSCRLPGSAQDPSSLWDMLVSGRTAWTPGPGKRFNMKAFQDPSAHKAGTTNTGGGHFLKEDVSAFDAAFFGIHHFEAMAMDPQHRILLEIAYESFQNAGISTESLWASNTGVFVGQWTADYHEIQTRDVEASPLYLTTGTGPAISSNRISYYFNLRGPSFTVDTGCSSSLVALHQAVNSLRTGESSQCFVGGVNLLLDPQRFVYQSKLKMFSKEGRSYAFDSRANGYGRGEGCTGVLLKPLSAALRDGDHVRAVIRNSALNQDGRTPGISVPSSLAQKEAIIKAYRQANLDLHADYVEAHGTGTKVGDPIEASAIAAALTQGRTSDNPLPIGSIKANIGHTEGTAGLAGLIKAVLMLEHGTIPPQANYKTHNPDVLLNEWKLRIPIKLERCNLRRISVNSFGYGGTNAHVVIDGVTDIATSTAMRLALNNRLSTSPFGAKTPRVFFISASSESSCQRTCSRLAQYLVTKHRNSPNTDSIMARLAYSLGKQSTHPHRLILVACNMDDLIQQLNLATCSSVPHRDVKAEPRIAFVFSGQGAQYPEMGRELLHSYPSFAKSIERARQQLIHLGCDWDLLSELCRPKSESRINQPAVSQPACTAIQLALVDLLVQSGVSACAVVGHSSGEIAAAYMAGAISFEDAITASYFRGKFTGQLIAGELEIAGAMLAVGADPNLIEGHISHLGHKYGRIKIACFNSPSSVTVSGDAPAIDALKEALDSEGTFNRKLMTNGAAYHSHQMTLVENDYATSLKRLLQSRQVITSSVRMFSSVSGTEVPKGTALSDDYWVQNLLSPVLFSQAVSVLCQERFRGESIDLVVEVGPHSQLGGPIKQILKSLPGEAGRINYSSTLKRGKDAEVAFLECLGFLHTHSASPRPAELNKVDRDCPPSLLVDLPSYPWDHQRTFWHETRISKDYRHRQHLPHELLGTLCSDVNHSEPRWRRILSLKDSPWLRGHRVQGQIVFPAAGYLTMAVQAMRQYMLKSNPSATVESIVFRNISIGKALVITEDGPDVEISLSLRPEVRSARGSSSTWKDFRIFTVGPDGAWNEHCRGAIQAETQAVDLLDVIPDMDGLPHVEERCTHTTSPLKFYHLSRGKGLDWQEPFNCVSDICNCALDCVTKARQPILETAEGGMGDIIHPALLDSCLFHGLCSNIYLERGVKSTVVPTFIKQLRIFNRSPGAGAEIHSTTTGTRDTLDYNVVVQSSGSTESNVVLVAHGVHTTKLPEDTMLGQETRDICHGQEWVTYVDSWTVEHRDSICKSVDLRRPAPERTSFLNALAKHYIQAALKELDRAEQLQDHYFSFLESLLPPNARTSPTLSTFPIRPSGLEIGAIGEATLRLGPQLRDIATGRINPPVILDLENLQCTSHISQLASYCHELGRQKPGLRVLELCGATGTLSLQILDALKERSESYVSRYELATRTQKRLDETQKQLGELSDAIVCSVLNIEQAAKDQGFEESSYDLIIANNVVHTATHINKALENIKTLLKPGGKFVLMESTEAETFYRLLLGVSESWSADYEVTGSLCPLLPSSEWAARLEDVGFSVSSPLLEDKSNADGSATVVFVTSAPWGMMRTGLPTLDLVTTEFEEGKITHSLAVFQAALPGIEIEARSLTTPRMASSITVLLPEIGRLLCENPNRESWESFQRCILKSSAVLLVSCGQLQNLRDTIGGLWTGLARTLRQEHPDIRIVTLEIEGPDDVVLRRLAAVLPTILNSPTFDMEFEASAVENEFAERDGQLFVSRLIPRREITNYVHRSRQESGPEMVPFLDKNRILTAELGVTGLLDSLRWKDDIEAPCMGSDDLRIELRAASINFKDVLIAAGQLEGITEMRNDCSGVVIDVGTNMRHRFKSGDRVCALYSRSYTNYPVVHGDCCQIIPNNLTYEEGASLPIVWTTVYYSLVDMGKLSRRDKILIHSAAGALGQAAIMLAQHIGAEIFVTVGSNSKRDLLQERYGIARDHMFSSRTTAFHSGIKRITAGYGVDVVLNSLSGEIFRESCNLVAPFGRFVEVGRKELMDDALMPMAFLLKNITFAYVDLTLIINTKKTLAKRLLRDVADLAEAEHIKPVMLTVMPISAMEAAFRQIQGGKHTGKIILTVQEKQEVKAIPPVPQQAQLKADATYVVVGGFGGLGRAIIAWMADCGARNIVSASRSGAKSKDGQAFIAEMKAKGVVVVARECDVTLEDAVSSLIEKSLTQGLPPIRGVIQSAMVLKDAIFEDITDEQWRSALAPKVRGTKNLHEAFGSTLDFFIIMSSAVAIRGNIGQSNYAAACSFQDELARHRVAIGLPAFSINIGAVLEAGFVSENPEIAETLRRQGLGTVSVSHLLALLSYAVTHPYGSDKDVPSLSVCSLSLLPDGEKFVAEDVGMTDRRFAHVVRHGKGSGTSEGTSIGVPQLLEAASRFEDAVGIVTDAILHQLGKLIATPVESLSAAQSLDSYGVDSLVAVELRNWIGAYLQANVQLMVLRATSSISDLAKIVSQESRLVGFK